LKISKAKSPSPGSCEPLKSIKNKKRMKRLIAVIGIVTISLQVGFSADKYEVGDTLFVWAKSGLNLRESTGTNSKG
jgi:hypothetical protein